MWFPTDFDYAAAVAAGLLPEEEELLVNVHGQKVPVNRQSDSNWCKQCEIYTNEDTCFICDNTDMVEASGKVRQRYPSTMQKAVLVSDIISSDDDSPAAVTAVEQYINPEMEDGGVVLSEYPY